MQMIMFVLDDPTRLDELLDAWYEVGIQGVTIVESTGLHRRRAQTLGARYSFGFPRVVEAIEEGHYTLFAVVADEDAVQTCLDAVESVVGDLIEPHSGVYASWELSTAKGTPSQLHTQAAAS